MIQEKVLNIRNSLESARTVLVPIEESFLSQEDFNHLEHLSEQVPYEFVEIGDAGEPNHVQVGRFMTDVDVPRKVNQPYADQVLEILESDHVREAHKQILGGDDAYIRRVQINILEPGGFVGYHLDTDSNPDYEFAVTIQMGHNFTGGAFVTHPEEGRTNKFKPSYASMIISHCSLPHEVERVESGCRKSFVYFLARHGNENRRASAA